MQAANTDLQSRADTLAKQLEEAEAARAAADAQHSAAVAEAAAGREGEAALASALAQHKARAESARAAVRACPSACCDRRKGGVGV